MASDSRKPFDSRNSRRYRGSSNCLRKHLTCLRAPPPVHHTWFPLCLFHTFVQLVGSHVPRAGIRLRQGFSDNDLIDSHSSCRELVDRCSDEFGRRHQCRAVGIFCTVVVVLNLMNQRMVKEVQTGCDQASHCKSRCSFRRPWRCLHSWRYICL